MSDDDTQATAVSAERTKAANRQRQASADQAKAATDIESIRREGLTGRQLRMARRVAQKNGISATSDFEAVKLLREKGIDPFQTTGALELVIPNTADTQILPDENVQLPQTVPASKNLPPKPIDPADARAREISEIQLDIARRRRRKLFLLFARLGVFVGLPTAILGYYFAFVATPLYGTKSAFLIQQNDGASAAAGGLASMFGSNQLATVQDSIAVQGYLTSREAMLRLDTDHGFKSLFQNEELDPITRLDPDATNEDAYSLYKKHVKIGYDPTEGIVTMEVKAPSPEASEEFSNALIGYAEGQVSDLSLRLRNDQMQGARDAFAEAEVKRQDAAERLVGLQTDLQTVDATGVIASSQARIANFETQLEEKRIELQAQLANTRPNQSRVDGLEADIERLEESISSQKARLTQATDGGESLASIQAQIQIAQVDFQTRDLMLQQALQALETARISADRQVRYVAISTPPTAPDTPTYPRVFENTLLAFLIFLGIYLLVSLTVSILREQVSS
ncbi:MAG: capsule biosynthesis protein [Pseudomonadota bacterium]